MTRSIRRSAWVRLFILAFCGGGEPILDACGSEAIGVLRFGGRGDPFGDVVLLQVMETALQTCLFACVESGFSTVRGMF